MATIILTDSFRFGDRRLIEALVLESVVRAIPSTFAFLALMVKRIKPKIYDSNLIGTPR